MTRSEEGMSLYTKAGKEAHIETEARDVFDITGAGDTVISVIGDPSGYCLIASPSKMFARPMNHFA